MKRLVDFEISPDAQEPGLWQLAGRRSQNFSTVIDGCSLVDLVALHNQIAALLSKHTWDEVFGSAVENKRRELSGE